jgi:hypothetical protein
MRMLKGCPALFALLAFTSLSCFARDIKVDFDHHVNFSQYKTYSWAKVDASDPLWNDRVKEAVDRELTKKGWNQVPSGGDISIVAVGTTREKPTLRTFYDGFDGWMWSGFADATTYIENYTVGTLVIDMFDSTTKKLIWRGAASDVVSGKPEKDDKKLNEAVSKLFDHFPPKTT